MVPHPPTPPFPAPVMAQGKRRRRRARHWPMLRNWQWLKNWQWEDKVDSGSQLRYQWVKILTMSVLLPSFSSLKNRFDNARFLWVILAVPVYYTVLSVSNSWKLTENCGYILSGGNQLDLIPHIQVFPHCVFPHLTLRVVSIISDQERMTVL